MPRQLGLAEVATHVDVRNSSGSCWTSFSRALESVFEDVRVEPVTCFNDLVDEERTDWLFFGRRPAGKGHPGVAERNWHP